MGIKENVFNKSEKAEELTEKVTICGSKITLEKAFACVRHWLFVLTIRHRISLSFKKRLSLRISLIFSVIWFKLHVQYAVIMLFKNRFPGCFQDSSKWPYYLSSMSNFRFGYLDVFWI